MLGGTATYAARTARALGARVGVITSTSADLDLSPSLEGIPVRCIPASTSTTFENSYTEGGRRQLIRGRASPLGPSAVPQHWRPRLVHVGPVAQECDPALLSCFDGSFVGVTPQGWMRQWDATGRVRRSLWEGAERVLTRSDAVVLSEEDVGGDTTVVSQYARLTRCLVLTQGAAGCTVYAAGEVLQVPASQVREIDSTGAGDIFAACFFCALERGYHPRAAARFANCIAARSVTRLGLLGTPRDQEVAHCRRATLGDEQDDADDLCTG